ncbi:MAG: hypothetical protein U0176_09495 [Bacteroidia bacterium]
MKTLLPFFLFTLAFATTVLAQSGKFEGTITAHRGKVVEINPLFNNGDPFQSGMEATISKKFEEKLGNMTMQGWLVSGKVKLLSATNGKITVEILEEKSEITVNGEKVDHFKVGKYVKVEWPAKEQPSSTGTIESGK